MKQREKRMVTRQRAQQIGKDAGLAHSGSVV